MTDLDKLLELYGPYKKYPIAFVDYPQVNQIIDSIPQFCLELRAARKVVEAARVLWNSQNCLSIPAGHALDNLRDCLKELDGGATNGS